MAASAPAYDTQTFVNASGTRIAYQTVGDGPPVILANGLGGTFHTWRHLYGHLVPGYRVVSWDYRGLHGSDVPQNRLAVRVEDQVDDLEELLDLLHIDSAVFMGWSMGVQVNFELYRRRPETFRGIAALNGTAGRPFDTVVGARFNRYLLPVILGEMRRYAPAINALAQAASGWKGLARVLKQLGVVAPTLDEQVFGDLVVEFGNLDFGLYSDTLRLLGEHDAWDVLPRITVPTTVISGDRDVMTPVDTAERICRSIPDARLVVIPDCTHYAAVERPDVINEAVDDLLRRADYAARSLSANP